LPIDQPLVSIKAKFRAKYALAKELNRRHFKLRTRSINDTEWAIQILQPVRHKFYTVGNQTDVYWESMTSHIENFWPCREFEPPRL